ncbi:GNAT family N-acetyltransferase [Sedimentibacter sp. zth1]|uniref:GNAT family N-acetyltransferase n=1 Tax=Sedimentibacter sp. zth1 TaxID=2816908 RepID=UPI001A9119BC|nr:GNAT family N-acetyltransferase [Sedimentibacter sp. zth1]QSX06511.1 GNAT family N-acetyltransferase [Sedimentibacter sp. zth1]
MLLEKSVEIKELNLYEINKTLLDNFNRYQKVERCWRKDNNKWILKDNPFIENWDNEKKQQIISWLYDCKQQGDIVLAVFYDNKLIGFSSLGNTLFGQHKEYIELKMLQISYEYRNKGIGKKLFFLSVNKAIEKGAKKLYISAHSSEESQAFYKSIGCIEAQEINTQIAENEPFDCQMEYNLTY